MTEHDELVSRRAVLEALVACHAEADSLRAQLAAAQERIGGALSILRNGHYPNMVIWSERSAILDILAEPTSPTDEGGDK